MKKKLLLMATTVIMTLAVAFGMIACTDDEPKNDKFVDGEYTFWDINLESDEKWHALEMGRVKFENGKVSIIPDVEEESVEDGTYKFENGVLTWFGGDDTWTFKSHNGMWTSFGEDQKTDEVLALTPKGKTPVDYGDKYVVEQ